MAVIHKYGLPLASPDWAGLPMRVGHFPNAGRIEDLTCAHHSVLLWRGGKSRVHIVCTDADGKRHEEHFERPGGTIDFLPRGLAITEVRWQDDGLGSSCVSVNFPFGSLAHLLGAAGSALPEHTSPRFALHDPHAADLIGRLHAQGVSGSPLGAAYAQGLSLALTSYLFASDAKKRPSHGLAADPGGLPRLQSEALMVFVEDFLERDIGLVDMAALVGYSPDHFARLFRQTFRVSPHQYLLARRIERAKTLLRDPNVPIALIATQCGFSSQSHLTAVFKRHAGMTPGRYRKG